VVCIVVCVSRRSAGWLLLELFTARNEVITNERTQTRTFRSSTLQEGIMMRSRMLVTAVVAVLAVLVSSGAALGQTVPPGPTLVYRTSMEVTNAPAAFDVINLVLDFAPGAQTPVHTHGGHGIATVLEGEIVHRPQGGEARRLVAGESFL